MANAVQFPIILMALIETALTFQCNIPGQCINSLYIGALQVQHVNQCIEACRADQDCFWSSINPVFGTCNMYSDCNVIEDTDCPYCLTNEKSCANIQCNIQGACMVSFPYKVSRLCECHYGNRVIIICTNALIGRSLSSWIFSESWILFVVLPTNTRMYLVHFWFWYKELQAL